MLEQGSGGEEVLMEQSGVSCGLLGEGAVSRCNATGSKPAFELADTVQQGKASVPPASPERGQKKQAGEAGMHGKVQGELTLCRAAHQMGLAAGTAKQGMYLRTALKLRTCAARPPHFAQQLVHFGHHVSCVLQGCNKKRQEVTAPERQLVHFDTT